MKNTHAPQEAVPAARLRQSNCVSTVHHHRHRRSPLFMSSLIPSLLKECHDLQAELADCRRSLGLTPIGEAPPARTNYTVQSPGRTNYQTSDAGFVNHACPAAGKINHDDVPPGRTHYTVQSPGRTNYPISDSGIVNHPCPAVGKCASYSAGGVGVVSYAVPTIPATYNFSVAAPPNSASQGTARKPCPVNYDVVCPGKTGYAVLSASGASYHVQSPGVCNYSIQACVINIS